LFFVAIRNYLDCVSKVYAKEGLGGFFRGFSPAMVRAFPANAACFLGYEYTKAFLMRK
jgi:solute carrier family 25 carnitine/acylcarnitine transporter 20/29